MEDSDSDSDTWYICKYCKKNWKGKTALNAHKKEQHLTEIRAKITCQKGDSRPVINTHHASSSSSSRSIAYSNFKKFKTTTTESNSKPAKRRKVESSAVDSDSDTSSGDEKEYTKLSVNKIFLPSNKITSSMPPSIPISSSSSSIVPHCSSSKLHTSTISQKQPQPTNEGNLITQQSTLTNKTIPVPLEITRTTSQIDTTSDNNNNNNNNNTEQEEEDDLEIVYECSSNTSRGTTPLPQVESSSLNKNIVPSSPPPSSSTTRLYTNILKDVKITPVSSTLPSPLQQQEQQQAYYRMKHGNLETVVDFEPKVQNEILSVLSNRPQLNIFSTTTQNVSSFHENLEQYQKEKLLQKQQKQKIIKTTFNSSQNDNNNTNDTTTTTTTNDNFNPCISSTYSIIDINTNEPTTTSVQPNISNDIEIDRNKFEHEAPLKITRVSSSTLNNNQNSNNNNNTITTGNDQNLKKCSSFTMSLGELINKVTSDMLLSDSSSHQLDKNLILDSNSNKNAKDSNYNDTVLQSKSSFYTKETVKSYLETKKNTHHQYMNTSATITPITSSHPQSPYSLNHDSTKSTTAISQEKDSSSNPFQCFCKRVFTTKGGLRRHQTKTHKLPPKSRSNHNPNSINNNNNNNKSIWDKLLDDSNAIISSRSNINADTDLNRPHQITSPQSCQETSSLLTVNNKTSVEYNHQIRHANNNLSPSSIITTLTSTASTIPVVNSLSSSRNNLLSKIDEPCTDIPKNYQCLVCQAYFVTEAGMSHHLKSHKNISLKIAYGCSTCKMRFPNEEQRNTHVAENHPNQVVQRISSSTMQTRSKDSDVQIILDGQVGRNGKTHPTTSTTINNNTNKTKQIDVIDIDLSPEPIQNFNDEATTTGKHSLSSETESKDKDQTSNSTDRNSIIVNPENRCYICAAPFDSLKVLNKHIFSVHCESENNSHNNNNTTTSVQSKQQQQPSNNSCLIGKKVEDSKRLCNTCGIGFPNVTALTIHWKLVGHKS